MIINSIIRNPLLGAVVKMIPVSWWYDVSNPAPLFADGSKRFKPEESGRVVVE